MKPGEIIGPYRIEAALGKGGMARVFKAVHTQDGSVAALKVFSPDELSIREYFNRCKREIVTLQRCEHPNIIKVLGYALDTSSGYLALEHVDGQNLDQLVRREGKLGWDRVEPLARQVAGALGHIHARHLFHRDIKPANIMVERATGRAVLLDFGIVKATEMTDLSVSSKLMGTLCYMSPEQYATELVDARTDLYLFGLVLFKLITGNDPPSISEIEIDLKMTPDRTPLDVAAGVGPSIPADFVALVRRCLSPRKDDRYATAADLLADLDAIQAGKPLAKPKAVAKAARTTLRMESKPTGPVHETLRGIALPKDTGQGASSPTRPTHSHTYPRWVVLAIGLGPIVLLVLLGAAIWVFKH